MENVKDKWVQLGLKAYAGLYFLILLKRVESMPNYFELLECIKG